MKSLTALRSYAQGDGFSIFFFRGFRVNFWGVPATRSIVHYGQFCGPSFFGKLEKIKAGPLDVPLGIDAREE